MTNKRNDKLYTWVLNSFDPWVTFDASRKYSNGVLVDNPKIKFVIHPWSVDSTLSLQSYGKSSSVTLGYMPNDTPVKISINKFVTEVTNTIRIYYDYNGLFSDYYKKLETAINNPSVGETLDIDFDVFTLNDNLKHFNKRMLGEDWKTKLVYMIWLGLDTTLENDPDGPHYTDVVRKSIMSMMQKRIGRQV